MKGKQGIKMNIAGIYRHCGDMSSIWRCQVQAGEESALLQDSSVVKETWRRDFFLKIYSSIWKSTAI